MEQANVDTEGGLRPTLLMGNQAHRGVVMNTNMDNWQIGFGMITFSILIVMGIFILDSYDHTQYRGTGTVYIREQGCILSMTSESSILTINEDQVWCMEMHLQYLSELKNK
jgi:hypothetical protein